MSLISDGAISRAQRLASKNVELLAEWVRLGYQVVVTEPSAALAISPRKLWGMTASREIPHVRVGRCVRYPLDDLQRWIDAQKEGGDDR